MESFFLFAVFTLPIIHFVCVFLTPPPPPNTRKQFCIRIVLIFSWTFNRPERNVNNAYAKLFACVGEQETRKQIVLWEMWKWRINRSDGLNFHKYRIPDRRQWLKSSIRLHYTSAPLHGALNKLLGPGSGEISGVLTPNPMLNSPLSLGGRGAEVSIDWCIISFFQSKNQRAKAGSMALNCRNFHAISGMLRHGSPHNLHNLAKWHLKRIDRFHVTPYHFRSAILVYHFRLRNFSHNYHSR